MSLSLRRAWIEILLSIKACNRDFPSLSLRRAWIEISRHATTSTHTPRRSPYGERGLKLLLLGDDAENAAGRSPYGERGLKSEDALLTAFDGESLSLRRAWIEICICAMAIA